MKCLLVQTDNVEEGEGFGAADCMDARRSGERSRSEECSYILDTNEGVARRAVAGNECEMLPLDAVFDTGEVAGWGGGAPPPAGGGGAPPPPFPTWRPPPQHVGPPPFANTLFMSFCAASPCAPAVTTTLLINFIPNGIFPATQCGDPPAVGQIC